MSRKSKISRGKVVPGNTLEEQRQFDDMVLRLGRAWLDLVSQMHHLHREGIRVHRVTIKGGWTGGQELLVVLAADTPDGPQVAFHSVSDELNLARSLANRLAGESLKWRKDEYA